MSVPDISWSRTHLAKLAKPARSGPLPPQLSHRTPRFSLGDRARHPTVVFGNGSALLEQLLLILTEITEAFHHRPPAKLQSRSAREPHTDSEELPVGGSPGEPHRQRTKNQSFCIGLLELFR